MKISAVILSIVIALSTTVTAWTQQTTKVIQQAMGSFYHAREGNFEVVPKTVSKLEEATAADPNNGELWRTLGSAYFLELTVSTRAGEGVTALSSYRFDYTRNFGPGSPVE